jgi:archaellum component FlaF (FlaF/FlaG flagellin family)
MMDMNRGLLQLIILVFFTITPLFSQNLRLGIVMIENPQSDEAIASLCETATDTIEITLGMADSYDIERLDFLSPGADLERAKLYFSSMGFDNAVFGQIKGSDAEGYIFIIEGWERKSDKILVRIEKTAESVFDLFDIVDNLTAELFEELTGDHLGFGRVVYQREGIEVDYDIEIDGLYIGRNIAEGDVVEGERNFTIRATGRYGDEVVKTAVIDIVENGEYSIEFSMDDIIPNGNLILDADPMSSEVFIEDKSIGFTPLTLYNMEARPYNLHVTKEYYIPLNQVLDLEPNIDNTLSFDLNIDPENPEIKSRLKNPIKNEIIAVGITLGQMALFMGKTVLLNSGEMKMDFVDVLLLTPRYGHLLSENSKTGSILSLISFVSLTGFTGIYDNLLQTSFKDGGALYISALTLPLIGSVLFDLVGTTYASEGWNRRYINKLKQEGISFEATDSKDPLRFTIQAGGGGIVHAGVSWSPLWDWLYFEQLGGISLTQYFDILKPALSATSKILFYPLTDIMSLFNPYLGGIFNIGSDFNSINFAYGITSGIEIRLPWLDCFLEADLFVSNKFGTTPDSLALGVRL